MEEGTYNKMSLIVNPCERCVLYREQFVEYGNKFFRGDDKAAEGMKSVLDLALAEERDSEIEKILQKHPNICGENNVFCIYNKASLEKVSGAVNEVIGLVRKVDVEQRPLYIMLNFLKAMFPGLSEEQR